MKTLQILFLIVNFPLFAYSQSDSKLIKLSGVVFDINGAVVVKTRIIAFNNDDKKYQSETDTEGKYKLTVPVGIYNIDFDSIGFKKKTYQKFQIVNSTYGEMHQDVVLEVDDLEPCGYSGADCLNTIINFDREKIEVSNKILHRHLKELPKN